jgi:hypothetical protein
LPIAPGRAKQYQASEGSYGRYLYFSYTDADEVETLLKTRADARMKDSKGRTALDYLNAANCGSPIVDEKDARWMTVGHSRCNALDHDDYQKSN